MYLIKMLLRNSLWLVALALSVYLDRTEVLLISLLIAALQLTIYVLRIVYFNKDKYCLSSSYLRETIWLMLISSIIYVQVRYVNIILLNITLVVLILFYLSSFITFRIHKKHLRLDCSFRYAKEYPTKDDDVYLEVKYKAPRWLSILPLNLGNLRITITYGTEGEEFYKDSFSFTEGFDKEYILKFPYRGKYNSGVTLIEIEDTIGFFYHKINSDLHEVKIYPRVVHLTYKKNASYVGIYENKEMLSKTGDKFDLREFTNSDSTKYINWRIYAKKQELYVKDSEMTSFVGNRMIFLDNRIVSNNLNTQRAITEELFETLLSLMSTIYKAKELQTLYTLNDSGRLNKYAYKLHRFSTIKEEVSFIPMVEEMTSKHQFDLEEAVKLHYKSCELIIVTSKLDNQMRTIITRYAKSQVRLRVLYICPYTGKEKIMQEEQKLRRLGVSGLVISLENLKNVKNEVLL